MTGMEPGLAGQVDAMRLSLEDAFECVRDGADIRHLVSRTFLEERRKAQRSAVREPRAGRFTSAPSMVTGWPCRLSRASLAILGPGS